MTVEIQEGILVIQIELSLMV